jgi:hypothetical protein
MDPPSATDYSLMKKARRQENAKRRMLRGKILTTLVCVILGLILATFILVNWQKATRPVDTGDYEGRIVDRWGQYAESEQGSRPQFRLLIETGDGRRFPVKIDANVYESARIGMRIRRRSGQVVLIEPASSSTGSK